MALVVETGSGVSGANSYLKVAELRAFAADRGLSLPAGDSAVEALLIKAADYLELKSYIGVKFTDSQGLSWPRLETVYVPTESTAIPSVLKRAQSILAMEAQNGELSWATRPGKYIQTKIDVIYIKYASDKDRASGLRFNSVEDLLSGILSVSGSRPLVSVRA